MELLSLLVVVACLVFTGCEEGVNSATVEGIVTLDGDPLPNAELKFYPTEGRASMGTTDATGHYELMFTYDEPGAAPGTHSIEISTAIPESDERGAAIAPELLPTKYNTQTELSEEVSDGKNEINFDLKSE